MSAVQRILVPTDFSSNAEYAIRYAFAFAKKTGATIDFVHVLEPLCDRVVYDIALEENNVANVNRIAREVSLERLKKLAHRAEALGIISDTHLESGAAVDVITALAKELGSTVVVLASHGHSGFDALVFGSTSEKLIRLSPSPVLVIKHPEYEFVQQDSLDIHLTKVLCPIDFSDFSKRVLPLAVTICREYNATLVLAHVVEPHVEMSPFLSELSMSHVEPQESTVHTHIEQVAKQIQDCAVDEVILEGSVHRELVNLIDAHGIGLVIMATHGRGGIAHAVFGSTTEKMIRSAPCPVLTLRPDLVNMELPKGEGVGKKGEVSHFFG